MAGLHRQRDIIVGDLTELTDGQPVQVAKSVAQSLKATLPDRSERFVKLKRFLPWLVHKGRDVAAPAYVNSELDVARRSWAADSGRSVRDMAGIVAEKICIHRFKRKRL